MTGEKDSTVVSIPLRSPDLFRDGPTSVHSALPRLSLKKRKSPTEDNVVPLTSVNSAFLNSLFEDVAEIQKSSSSTAQSSLIAPESTAPVQESYLPSPKKSRSSLARSNKSYGWLCDAIFSGEPFSPGSQRPTAPRRCSVETAASGPARESSNTEVPGLVEVGSTRKASCPSFPHLPPTVSITSCTTLTRTLSDLQQSETENPEKESYGWFVEMDDGGAAPVADPYQRHSSSSKLAFVAPTAPNAENYDAEVEWAKAADTVDDVLGDFF